MNTEKSRKNPDFFSELRQRLRDAGFEATVTEDGTLSVTCQKHPVCSVDCRGNVQYPSEYKTEEGFYTQLGKVSDLVQSTARYIELVEQAPPLDAYGLEGDYRLLSKFNDVVLAAHPNEREIQFITWKQNSDGKSLWGGHSDSYTIGIKQVLHYERNEGKEMKPVKAPLREIAMYHMIKEDGVEKSKKRALQKLRDRYPNSRMWEWDRIVCLMRRLR